jgi:hypothetical protein
MVSILMVDWVVCLVECEGCSVIESCDCDDERMKWLKDGRREGLYRGSAGCWPGLTCLTNNQAVVAFLCEYLGTCLPAYLLALDSMVLV